MNTAERAAAAKRLRENEDFVAFMGEVRDNALSLFVNSGAGDTGVREEAHAIVRALSTIEATLDAAEAAQSLEEKRKQDRA